MYIVIYMINKIYNIFFIIRIIIFIIELLLYYKI